MRAGRTSLLEQVRFTKPLKVDRDQGIIYDCKLLGWDSRNGYGYDPQGAKRAVERGLYESAACYTNHPPKGPDGRLQPRAERDVKDAFGRYFGVRWRPDGVYGNLKYNRAHDLAESIANDAEEGIGNFQLSHNADGDKVMTPDGTRIREILEVRSVDIVTRGATTCSLSESYREPSMKRIKVWHLLESLSADRRAPIKTRRKLMALLEAWEDEQGKMGGKPCAKTTMEAAEMDAPAAMEEGADPAAPMDHNEILGGGFSAACHALLDEDLDDATLMKRMKELLKGKASLLGAKGEAPEEEDDDGIQESVKTLRQENAAYKLLMESGIISPPEYLVKSMSLMESEQEQRKLLHGYRMDPVNGLQRNLPRGQPRGGSGGAPQPKPPANYDEWVKAVAQN